MTQYLLSKRVASILEVIFTEEFDDTGDWTTSHGSIAVNGDGIKLTHSGDGNRTAYMEKTFSPALDLSGCSWNVDLSIEDNSSIDAVSMQLVDASENEARWDLVSGLLDFLGAHNLDVTPTSAYEAYSTDLSAVTKIRMRVGTGSPFTATPEVTFKRVRFFNHGTGPGYLCMIFDGGWDTHVRAGDYLTSKGLIGAFCVDENLTGDSGRMTLANLSYLAGLGHLIASYPFYSVYWQNKTLQDKKDHITANAAWLTTNGHTQGTKVVATPGGATTLDEVELFSQNYVTHITSRKGESLSNRPVSLPYSSHLDMSVGPSIANSVRQTAINAAIADHAVATFTFHQCDGQSDDISYADFQAIVDWVKDQVDAGDLLVITPTQIPQYVIGS